MLRARRRTRRRSSYLGARRAAAGARARRSSAFFADYDAAADAALAERPLPIGECDGARRATRWPTSPRSGRFTPFTALFNVTGQPAISVPLGFGDDGLPTGVQLVGQPLGEDPLLQVAAQLEAARPWAAAARPA